MTLVSCDNWGTNEEARGPRARLRAAYVRLQGDEPHRRGLYAPPRPRRAARARRPPAAVGDARHPARLSSPAPRLERLGGAFESDAGGVGRGAAARISSPRGSRAHVRLLFERARPAAAATRRPPRGPLRFLW